MKTTCSFLSRLKVAVFAIASVIPVSFAQSATLVANGPNQGSFRTPPYTVSASVQNFNVPYSRLTDVSYDFAAAAMISQYFSTGGNHSVNGNTSLTLLRNGSPVTTIYLFPYGNGFGTGTVSGFDDNQVIDSLPLTSSPGTFSIQSNSGSGPSLATVARLSVIYTYTPIGLTQSDPILPSQNSNGRFTFSSVPSGRWFDPPTVDSFRFDIASAGDSFAAVSGFPMGFSDEFLISINGIEYGNYGPGDTFAFPPGTTSFLISGISPEVDFGDTDAFPIKLDFNRDNVTFTMTAIPEANTALWSLSSIAFGFVRHRRSRMQ